MRKYLTWKYITIYIYCFFGVIIVALSTVIIYTYFSEHVLSDSSKKIIPTIKTTNPTPDFKKEIISTINNARQNAGVDNLVENTLLDESAKEKAEDIMNKNYWSQNSPDGKSPSGFITQNGYDYNYSSLLLARGFDTAEDTVRGWINSENKNDLLATKYDDIGVAIKKGILTGNETTIVVVFLASKKLPTNQDNNKNTNLNNNNSSNITSINCEIKGIGWVTYPDKDSCLNAQLNQYKLLNPQQNNTSNNDVYPTYIPHSYPTYAPYPTSKLYPTYPPYQSPTPFIDVQKRISGCRAGCIQQAELTVNESSGSLTKCYISKSANPSSCGWMLDKEEELALECQSKCK